MYAERLANMKLERSRIKSLGGNRTFRNADFDGDSVSGDTWVIVRSDSGVELKKIKDVE